MESITIHFGPKKVSSEDDEASTKKKDDEEETFKGPKGRTNVWWKDVKYTPPKKTGPAKRVNLWWKRDLKKKVLVHILQLSHCLLLESFFLTHVFHSHHHHS